MCVHIHILMYPTCSSSCAKRGSIHTYTHIHHFSGPSICTGTRASRVYHFAYTYTHTYIHTYTYTYTHTHIHTYTHTHIHTYTHIAFQWTLDLHRNSSKSGISFCLHIHTYTHTHIHT